MESFLKLGVMRISAIDVGSNAVRMMIAEWEKDRFSVLKKYRMPLRLGADVFHGGEISPSTLEKAVHCFQEFAEINQKMKVLRCRAVATSATREAKNRQTLLDLIKRNSGLSLEIIGGIEEAKLIFTAVKHHVNLRHKKTLLIDLGGGSVEITVSESGALQTSQSFPLGTVRILEILKSRKMTEHHIRMIMGEILSPVVKYFDQELSGHSFDIAVGTGGNLECMARLKTQLLGEISNESILTHELSMISEKLLSLSLRDRIQKLSLREDRADVIVPATSVVEAILRQAGVDRILIPGVGLRDGVLYSMIE